MTSFVYGFYGIRASPDLADSSTYAAWYTGPPLGLPNRDYYWTDDEGEPIREAYRANDRSLGYGGYAAADAEDAASGSTSSRSASPSRSCARRISTIRATITAAPHRRPDRRQSGLRLAGVPEHLGIPEEETIVVTELKYLSAVDAILAKTDLETLKDYLKLQILLSTARLEREMGQTLFDFYGTTLNGVEEREPLAERALSDVNGALGFASASSTSTSISRRKRRRRSRSWSPASSPPPGYGSKRSTGCRRRPKRRPSPNSTPCASRSATPTSGARTRA